MRLSVTTPVLRETDSQDPTQKPLRNQKSLSAPGEGEPLTSSSSSQRRTTYGDIQRVHFVGIGGVGMSALAEILMSQNLEVSGSDRSENALTRHLRARGARVRIGHSSQNLGRAQVVVYSSAIRQENPEIATARERNLILVHRGEMLADLMRWRRGISVTGTHGKTTTTAMAAFPLIEAGLDPAVVVGARVRGLGGNARSGHGPYFLAEADESDRSFLKLRPELALVTNIDLDHMDEYQDLEDLLNAFRLHMDSVPFFGAVIACRDDANLRSILKNIHRPMLTYGLEEGADIRGTHIELEPLESRYRCFFQETELGQIRLKVAGRHNVLNSLAAVGAALHLGISFREIQQGLAKFSGAERRLEFKGELGGVSVFDDYAHHPVEIQATLDACSRMKKRIVLVFQPHRYSRTLHQMQDFASCFQRADHLFLMDIYAAGEDPIEGVTSKRLAGLIAESRQVAHVSSPDEVVERLRKETSPGDLILTMGAGDVWKIGERFIAGNQ